MTAALQGLTARGRGLLAAGVALIAFSLVAAEQDVLRVGVLLAALPLAAAVSVARTRYRLTISRTVEPGRVPVDTPATVRIRLANSSRLPTGTLRLADTLPWSFGEPRRFVLGRLEPGDTREVSYPLRSPVRGRFTVGPLTLQLADPFGLCEISHSYADSDVLVVTPAVSALPMLALPGERLGGAEGRERSLAAHGEDDVAVREYRHGDDLRRVHWRSSARAGELMVRREERPWQRSATLLLDLRRMAHRGDAIHGSLEWAVAAAASIGVHLLAAGYRLQVVDGSEPLTPATSRERLLDRLAVASPTKERSLRPLVAHLARHSPEGLLVAVVGAVDAADWALLATLRQDRTCAVGFLLDPFRFSAGTAPRRGDGGAAALRGAGWRIVEVGPDQTVPTAWALAAVSPGATAAGRGSTLTVTSP